MRWMNEEHEMKHLTNLKWDQVNVPTIERMVQQAVQRGPETKKRNYGEKVDHDTAPYQLVEAFPDIEKLLCEHGINNLKSAFSWLRHRYVLLVHSYHCILRCESIFKGELSDCLMVKIQCEPMK
jgi:hypothetical protein